MGFRIPETRRRKLPYTSIKKRYFLGQHGVTLVEILMYVNILFLLVLLLLPLMQTFFKPLSLYTQIRLEREAAIFFRHTENELIEAHDYATYFPENPLYADQLIFITDSGSYAYSRKGNKIVREKLGRGGHIEMAHFVKEFRFTKVNERMFHISLKLEENGVKYEVERLMGLKVNKEKAAGTE